MIHSKCLVLLLGLGLILPLTSPPAEAKRKKKPKVENADDLLIVDCTLQGRTRRIGKLPPYIGKGRRIRTSAIDCQIRGGTYTEYDRSTYASSLEFWLPDANAGEPQAQLYVGQLYEKGLTATPDYEAAAFWYGKAAKQGNARAQVNLAYLHEQGLGVTQDPERARDLYSLAAGMSEKEIIDVRRETEKLNKDLELLNQKMKDLEQQLEKTKSERQQAEADAEELRQRLKEAQESKASGGTPTESVEDLTAKLEQQERVVTATARVEEENQAAFADLAKQVRAARAKNREMTRSAVAAPTIEIIRPDVLTTRGPALVPVPSGTTRMRVQGRVTAPAGIQKLTVDDRKLAVDRNGVFSADVAIAKGKLEINFEVVDRVGRDARALLVLLPQESDVSRPQPSGSSPSPQRQPSPVVESGNYFALIIGLADYDHLTDLETAERDAQEIEAILARKYGFRTTLLTNPTKFRMLAALNRLSESLEPEAHLLIYYAGHGEIEPGSQKGYWIPADAEPSNQRSWIPNEAISDILDLIPAKHILVVSDSCYSGTLTNARLADLKPPLQSAGSRNAADRRSRQVLTSGGLEPVLDGSVDGGRHSLFAGALLRVLSLSTGELSGHELHRAVASRVVIRADELGVDQVPQYAPIQFSGHEAGEFVLKPQQIQLSESR